MRGNHMTILRQALFVLLAWCAAFQVQAAATEKPSEVAGTATAKVIKLLVGGQDKYKKDPAQFAEDVEGIIDPLIAFDDVARGVMGRYAHRASPQELQAFTRVFRESLVQFYSRAVQSFNIQNLALEKVDEVPAALMAQYKAGKSRSVPVNILIRSRAQSYQLSYSMMEQNNRWMVRNIIVEGINLGLQLRNQYQDAMNRYKTVAKVTEMWPELMKSVEQDDIAKQGKK